MGVRDHQRDAPEAAEQALEEGRPERLRLGGAEAQADELAPALGVHRHRDYRGHGDDPTALPDLQEVASSHRYGHSPCSWRPKKAPTRSSMSLHSLRRCSCRSRTGPSPGQLVNPARGPAADPVGRRCRPTLDDRGREVAALPELRDSGLERAEARVERPVAVPVAPVLRSGEHSCRPATTKALHVGLHQQLQHRRPPPQARRKLISPPRLGKPQSRCRELLAGEYLRSASAIKYCRRHAHARFCLVSHQRSTVSPSKKPTENRRSLALLPGSCEG